MYRGDFPQLSEVKERELKVNVTWVNGTHEWISHDERRFNTSARLYSYTHLEFNLNSKCEHLVIICLLFRYDLFKYTVLMMHLFI